MRFLDLMEFFFTTNRRITDVLNAPTEKQQAELDAYDLDEPELFGDDIDSELLE
jgi:hypothetical protein